jgi:hypothetical protein
MLHGGNSTAERQSSVDSFQNGDAFVFLISRLYGQTAISIERIETNFPTGTLAGGVGLNLTAVSRPGWTFSA